MIVMDAFTPPASLVDVSNVTYSINRTTAALVSPMPIWIRIVTLTSMVLIDISALLGNLLVICAFFRTRRLQTVTNYFIASLAFADALVAIFVLPLSIYCYQRDRSWKLGLILCDLWVSSDVLLCTSSILNLTCISVDRYMAITKPLTYTAYRSKFLARVMILLVWVVSIVITCPPIFGWRDKNRRQQVEQEHKCDLNTARGYVVYSALGSFYIPGVVMIFVYIRIFMVVYDRENLIKRFRSDDNSSSISSTANRLSGISLKSNHIDLSRSIRISNDNNQCRKFVAWCRDCFRKQSPDNPQIQAPTPHYSFSHCSNIEQKQNGYLVYRFTSSSSNNQNMNSNITMSSSVHTPRSNSKVSILSRTAHVPPEYQYRNDESSCYELKTIENYTLPSMKRRSRSFEQSAISKIRDLNTELSHSRQLKAAAVAAATVSTATNTSPILSENGTEQCVFPNTENHSDDLFSSVNESLYQTTQSLNELTQLSVNPSSPMLNKNHARETSALIRGTSTKNPSPGHRAFLHNPTYSYFIGHHQSLPEPTRINRRLKTSRSTTLSPSTLLIENFKQQNKSPTHLPVQSNQSTKCFSIIRRCMNRNNSSFENEINPRYPWLCCSSCCCYSSSMNSFNQHKTKLAFHSTPSQSLTNEDEEEDKVSSNDTATRTSLYTAAVSTRVGRTSVRNSAPGDVHRRERIRFMKEQKTAKTLAVVVGGFILLWLPFFIMYVIPPETHSLSDNAVTLITWLGYFNSVINPFIYAYCSKQFRMAFWNLTFGLCMKKSSTLLPRANKTKRLHQRRINS